jgi:hypothetical protein
MRPDLTLIWRVSDAALYLRELGEFQVSMGEHEWARVIPQLHQSSLFCRQVLQLPDNPYFGLAIFTDIRDSYGDNCNAPPHWA